MISDDPENETCFQLNRIVKPFALIIDDERDIAALFRHVLDMAGFQTEIAFHGQDAVERLSNSQPDIVLLDLNLPGVSGSEILEMIRKDNRLDHTKVIVITGHAHIAGGLSVQPDLVLLKPVSIDQLTSLVDRIILSEKSPKAIPLRQKPLDNRTGLYNQSFFLNRLESSLRQSREIDSYLFTVLLFNLERIKKTGNHASSYQWESVLHEMSGWLRRILRPTDTIARFDPDTFYILIENVPNGEIAVRIANRIQEILNQNVPDIGNKIKLPIRIGILLCDSGYENVDIVLSDARYALSLANAQGEEYVQYYYQVSSKKGNNQVSN
jgi:diguanylate cyclase (GGDEF)-like protein